jgi:hypothetical protein
VHPGPNLLQTVVGNVVCGDNVVASLAVHPSRSTLSTTTTTR